MARRYGAAPAAHQRVLRFDADHLEQLMLRLHRKARRAEKRYLRAAVALCRAEGLTRRAARALAQALDLSPPLFFPARIHDELRCCGYAHFNGLTPAGRREARRLRAAHPELTRAS